MEGEKETAEEKEDEEEDVQLHHHMAVVSSVDHQDLPILHWEDLSKRIAELEIMEQERREKWGTGVRKVGESRGCVWTDVWEEEEDSRRCRAASGTSRLHRNLQLCFINDSSEEEEEAAANHKVTIETGGNSCHGSGLKQEVIITLRMLRDKLMSEQRDVEECGACNSCVTKRKHLERWDLQECSVQQLISLKVTLQQEVHALSSELVTHLLVRDQLRTKQDAMLLDVQDLT